jgi:hypothetical protein
MPPIKVYLMTFVVPREPVLEVLDSRREVLNWFAVFSNVVLLASRSDLTALTGILQVSLPGLWFVLAEVDSTRVNGWMNREVWDFINTPKSSGRWE